MKFNEDRQFPFDIFFDSGMKSQNLIVPVFPGYDYFIKMTNFKGTPPTPGEVENTVNMVQYFKRIVQY
jgi:hypothetical protein